MLTDRLSKYDRSRIPFGADFWLTLTKGLRKGFSSLGVTLLGQAALLAGMFIVTRLSASSFGSVGFGEYQVARRTVAVIVFPLMCGIGVSMPRYIARDIDNKDEIATWLIAGTILGFSFLVVCLGIGLFWAPDFGRWTFGGTNRGPLFSCLLIAVAGQFSYGLAYAVLRGLSAFRVAAVLQITNGVVAPLVGLMFSGGRVERALSVTGGCWIAIGAATFVFVCREWALPLLRVRSLYPALRTLCVFGMPRIPGEIALFGLFALPAYAAVHRNDMVGAGLLSVALSMVQAIATLFAATGFVLLPYWSRARRDYQARKAVHRQLIALVVASLCLTTVMVISLEVWLQPVTRFLLGPLINAPLGDIRTVIIGSVPYVTYLVLRDYFDSVLIVPLNTVALVMALVIQGILLGVHRVSIGSSTTVSFFVLGVSMVILWIGFVPRHCKY